MSDQPHSPFPATLQAGPLDIVGDVHGEFEALQTLLAALGYDSAGQHAGGRRLVFVGDLGDRGPDSPAVIRFVAGLVANGDAQCVLGNHELNLLRNATKPGNGWFFATDHDQAKGNFRDCRAASAQDRADFLEFFTSLPLALERPDLRIVHAAWHTESLATLQSELAAQPLLEVYDRHKTAAEQWAKDASIAAAARAEYEEWGRHLTNEHLRVPLLPAIGSNDEYFQMANPVRVLTSGVERLAGATFFASGKWRMVNRVAWWHDYRDSVPVIFGHYWRWASPEGAALYSRGEQNLFDRVAANRWLGPLGTAFCVDYSVGVRYRERPLKAGTPWRGRLAAVRWPEQELVFDDGERLPLVA